MHQYCYVQERLGRMKTEKHDLCLYIQSATLRQFYGNFLLILSFLISPNNSSNCKNVLCAHYGKFGKYKKSTRKKFNFQQFHY